MLDGIAEAYPRETIVLSYHAWWPSSSDPYYLHNVDENTHRVEYYGADYTPHVYIDGIIDGEHSLPWESMMLSRYEVESPLELIVTGEMLTDTTGTITAEITNDTGTPVTGTLHFVILEDGLVYNDNPQNHTMRDFFPDVYGEETTFAPGVPEIRTETFTYHPEWVEDELQCVVFIQNDNTKEVYQAGRVYFRLDDPQFVVDGQSVDDSAGGDGNGYFDPGESAEITLLLSNLNIGPGTDITGTLTTDDEYLTIEDASGSWPDIPSGGSGENSADPFTVSFVESAPWGYKAEITLTVNANGRAYQDDFHIFVRSGSPGHPIGHDAYGYYAYEDVDDYPTAPVYDWIEIDPNLGGSGDLVTLGDNQGAAPFLPFDFSYYGDSFNRITLHSNGFVGMGIVGGLGIPNTGFPNSEGPNRIVAGFWADLNPTAEGSGQVYTYFDEANDRFVIEFSGVEHADPNDEGLPETFQFIFFDPAHYPTPTGDGEIIVQYKTVSLPDQCSVGMENNTGTIGLEYVYNGVLNGGAHGLVDGRAIRFTTTDPTGVVSVEGPSIAPATLFLVATPNPFRSSSVVGYSVPSAGEATIRVFSPNGALVRTLFSGKLDAGAGSVSWDGTDDRGIAMPAGVYVFRLSGPGYEESGKIVRVN